MTSNLTNKLDKKFYSLNSENYALDIMIKSLNSKLLDIVSDYSFYYISDIWDINKHQIILQNIKESESFIINKCNGNNKEDIFFVIGFKKTLIIIKQCLLHLVEPLFSINQDSTIYFLPTSKRNFSQHIKIKNQQIECDGLILNEISNFNNSLIIFYKSGQMILRNYNSITPCITGYLIEQSYMKLNLKQFDIFSFNSQDKKEYHIQDIVKDDYVVLRNIYQGNSRVDLIYVINQEELFILKSPRNESEIKLIEREMNNYSQINYPLLPKLYGIVKENNSLIIQFINGKTLNDIQQFHFSFDEKIIIIFEIMLIVKYLHQNNFVYRDLKPNNIMIDEIRTIFIIDFDRMIKLADIIENEEHTNNFLTVFVAPEVNFNQISLQMTYIQLDK